MAVRSKGTSIHTVCLCARPITLLVLVKWWHSDQGLAKFQENPINCSANNGAPLDNKRSRFVACLVAWLNGGIPTPLTCAATLPFPFIPQQPNPNKPKFTSRCHSRCRALVSYNRRWWRRVMGRRRRRGGRMMTATRAPLPPPLPLPSAPPARRCRGRPAIRRLRRG